MARVSKKTAPPRSASKSKKSSGTLRTSKSPSVTTQVKKSAMKVLAGAASGAVQALIPQLEEAAGRQAKSAGTANASEQKPKSRK